MNKIYVVFLFFIFFNFQFSFVNCQVPPPVPANLLSELTKKLKVIDSNITDKWNGTQYCFTTYSAELAPANSDLGPALLKSQALQDVINFLNALDSIKVKGVKISINYPILVSSFPLSTQYLGFYKQVIGEVRKKGLKLFVSCQASIKDTLFCKLNVDSFYTGLNTNRYKTEKKEMLQTIIDQLQPDYLTIENEPALMAVNTGLIFSVDSVNSYVKYFSSGLDKKTTMLGAGTPTWENINYIDKLAKISSIDYIDMHIGIIYNDFFYPNSIKIDSITKINNKKTVIGESWLYKISASDVEYNTINPDYDLTWDVFDTYIRVDSMFIKSVFKLSNLINAQFTSFLKSQYFYGYLKWDSLLYSSMPNYQIFHISDSLTFQNIIQGKLSRTGILYHNILSSYCNVGINEKHDIFNEAYLKVFPNPVNDIFILEMYIPRNDYIILKISDLEGRKIKTLLNGKFNKGKYNYQFSTDECQLANGIYYILFQTSQNKIYKKLVSLK